MYVYHYIEARSCNHCCSGKTLSITYPESVFVALGIQNATYMRHIVVCGLQSRSALQYDKGKTLVIINPAEYSKKVHTFLAAKDPPFAFQRPCRQI